MIPSHSGDCTRLLIWWWKSTVGSSPTGITNKMERVAQLVEHAITLTRILWEISSEVKSYFDLLNPWSQVRALPLSLVMRLFRILSTWQFSSNVINSVWGCSSVVEKTISFEILPRKSVDWESYFVYFEIIRSLVRIQPSPQKEKERIKN
jgi:hypothetical protein